MRLLSHVQPFGAPWTLTHQAPSSMGFSRQEYWSGLPFPSPGDLPNPGIKLRSPALQADASTSEPLGKPCYYCCYWVTSVVSDSVRPHRQKPTRLPRPWDSPARTLGWVAISFSSAWKWKVKVNSFSRVWLLRPHGLQPTRLLRPWDFPGKSIGVGCHCLLWGKP